MKKGIAPMKRIPATCSMRWSCREIALLETDAAEIEKGRLGENEDRGREGQEPHGKVEGIPASKVDVDEVQGSR